MSIVKHEYQVLVYSDTDRYPNMTPLEFGQMIQDHIRVVLTQKGIGRDRYVFHRGYDYILDDDTNEPELNR